MDPHWVGSDAVAYGKEHLGLFDFPGARPGKTLENWVWRCFGNGGLLAYQFFVTFLGWWVHIFPIQSLKVTSNDRDQKGVTTWITWRSECLSKNTQKNTTEHQKEVQLAGLVFGCKELKFDNLHPKKIGEMIQFFWAWHFFVTFLGWLSDPFQG